MATEDHWLRIDPYNYDTELEMALNRGYLTFSDCKSLYNKGRLTFKEFEYCKEHFDWNKENEERWQEL